MTKPSRIPAERAARHALLNSFTVSADLSGLDSLIVELEEGVEEAVRPAAQAAAQVLYDEVLKNAKALTKSGQLASSVYQAYSADKSGAKKATYHVSWNARKAPHGQCRRRAGRVVRRTRPMGDGRGQAAPRPGASPRC